jgi:hypothetical protein
LKINRILQTLFQISIVIGIFIYIFNNYSIIFRFENFNYLQLFLTIFLKSLNVLIVGYLNYFAFKILYSQISYMPILKIHVISLFGNFFSFAKSGTLYKAGALKTIYNLKLKEFSLFFIVSQLFPLLIISFATFSYIRVTSLDNSASNLFIIVSIVIFTFLFSIKVYISKISDIDDSAYMKKLFVMPNISKILLIQFSAVVINLIYNWTLSNSLGYSLSLFDNLMYTAASVFSIFLSLTPNALGIKEFIIINLGSITDFSPEYMFNLSIAERFSDVLMLAIIFLIIKLSGNNLSLKNNENNY